METLKRTKGAEVDLFMNWESFWWKCLTLDNTNCWDLKWQSPVLRPGCRAPQRLGFGWLMLLRYLVHKVWPCCAVPLLILLAPGHSRGTGTLLGRNFFEILCCSGSCHHFCCLSSAFSLSGKPYTWRRWWRKQTVVTQEYYSSSSWLKHFVCGVIYKCVYVGAWQKAGKLVFKFSV